MSSNPVPLVRESVVAAREAIKDKIHLTPVLSSTLLSAEASTPSLPVNVLFKAENLQKIGAFKIRGATHALLRLSDEELKNGVCTHSSGNHAQGVALAARERGVKAYIVMPNTAVSNKVEATKGYGAEVIFSGPTSGEREAKLKEVQERTGAVFVPPYNHPDIICGQGTLALEFIEQTKAQGNPLDVIITPCGGGGMLSGTALAASGSGIRVFGAEPSFEGADDCVRGLKTGERITYVKSSSIADGLRTIVGEIPFSVISNKEYVEGVFSVGEEEIKKALKIAIEKLKVFIEPSSAVPLAVLLFNEEFRKVLEDGNKEGRKMNVGIVFSGGNTTVEALAKLFA